MWSKFCGSEETKKPHSRLCGLVLCRRKTFAEALWHADDYAHVRVMPGRALATICHKTKKPAVAGFSG
jgi:hypothetical protein